MDDDANLEIEFPLAFHVPGTPVSLQASGRSRQKWKDEVLDACDTVLPKCKFATEVPLCFTIYDFPTDEPAGDVDNIVKIIIDALKGRIYTDDKCIKRVVVQRFLPREIEEMDNVPDLVGAALVNDRPMVYIQIHDDPLGEAK